MKNKKLTYILLVVVAVVWGTIVFQIFKHIKKPETTMETVAKTTEKGKNYLENDTLVPLKLNYSDPFLKGRSFTGNIARKSNTETGIGRRINPQENTISWPEIKFSGLIMNNKTNEKLGLIQINSESFLFRKGQEINELKLIELWTDSIRVKFKDQQKTFKKTS